jgi:hypothetical protein
VEVALGMHLRNEGVPLWGACHETTKIGAQLGAFPSHVAPTVEHVAQAGEAVVGDDTLDVVAHAKREQVDGTSCFAEIEPDRVL